PSKRPMRRAELARQGVETTFTLMDGGKLGPRSDAVDLVFSQSVLEHVVDLRSTLAESRRVLRDHGRFVAWFGPIWPTYGGSHISELGYDHLLLNGDELLARARRVGGGWEYWLELGLFNNLRYQDYIDAISEHFEIEWLGVAGSRDGAMFRERHPQQWAYLRETWDEFDLLTRLVGVVARPRR
ncbi:MAG: methyltransferase domain-containing protein, partial [Actinomycetota bacterium]|nr:methyltransferase domain-containing protein [Actinomycetota bacterium]